VDDRFRIDGVELGVDARRSSATLSAEGVLDATVVALGVPGSVAEWATVPPRLLLELVPVAFDGEGLGATVDQDLLDDLSFGDGGFSFSLSSRFDPQGRLAVLAGDRLRFTGEVETPWSSTPWRLDVSLGFGGRRRPLI
jgi:hypothetical protein